MIPDPELSYCLSNWGSTAAKGFDDVRDYQVRLSCALRPIKYDKVTMGLLSAEQAAAHLHLNVKRVQALARAGKLPGRRVGRRWLFDPRALEAALGAPAPAAAGARLPPPHPPPRRPLRAPPPGAVGGGAPGGRGPG